MLKLTQAIVTKHLPCTPTKGRRIKATAVAGSVTIPYNDDIGIHENHHFAAKQLQAKFGWEDELTGGMLSTGEHVWVMPMSID